MTYLEITLQVDAANRAAAAGVYQQYKQPFLDTVDGATSKELLVRDEDVQVLHGFGRFLDEIVRERLDDAHIERVGVVPVGAQRRGQHGAAVLVPRDVEGASVLVEDFDVAHARSPTRSPSRPWGRNTSTRISTMNA